MLEAMDTHKTIIISAPVPKYTAKICSVNESYGMSAYPEKCILNTSGLQKNSSLLTKSTPVTCISTMEKIPTAAVLSGGIVAIPSRKRRLDHLSFEEKMQRKKLKNRMAAQNSRDRKKAKMDELECEVKELRKKNEMLLKQCENLQSEKKQLVEENLELRRKLADNQTSSVGCSPCIAGPAVSNTDPQLQGQGLQLALGLVMMVLVSLRFRTYLENWRVMSALLSSVNLQIVGFEKLLMSWLSSNTRRERLLQDAKKEVLLKWWGRHQRTWNPVEDRL